MVFHTGNIASSVSFSLQDANYAYPTRQRILRKILCLQSDIQEKARVCKMNIIGFCLVTH